MQLNSLSKGHEIGFLLLLLHHSLTPLVCFRCFIFAHTHAHLTGQLHLKTTRETSYMHRIGLLGYRLWSELGLHIHTARMKPHLYSLVLITDLYFIK